jgi:hypothetical protein
VRQVKCVLGSLRVQGRVTVRRVDVEHRLGLPHR